MKKLEREKSVNASAASGEARPYISLARYVTAFGGIFLFVIASAYVALLVQGDVNVQFWDFFYGYSASRMAVLGHGNLVYNVHAFTQMQREVAGILHGPVNTITMLYPPPFILFWMPFALFPYYLAYSISFFMLSSRENVTLIAQR
jgi:hypothetical protein